MLTELARQKGILAEGLLDKLHEIYREYDWNDPEYNEDQMFYMKMEIYNFLREIKKLEETK